MWEITKSYNLRKCEYRPYGRHKVSIKEEENQPIECYFHKWTMETIQERDRYQDRLMWNVYPKAIIELEDGTISLVDPYTIKFINEGQNG